MNLPKRILVTGSSGYLGATLVLCLRKLGVETVGIDVVQDNGIRESNINLYFHNLLEVSDYESDTSTTDHVLDFSALSDEAIDDLMRNCEAVCNTAALHAPHDSSHTEEAFQQVNVEGTRKLLAAARREMARKREFSPNFSIPDFAFIHTSTTSLTITERVKQVEADGTRCVWLSDHSQAERATKFGDIESDKIDQPRNKYGRTKLAAEKLCFEESQKVENSKEVEQLNVVVLRTSRFFPEDAIETHDAISSQNLKANELLGRRVALSDALQGHIRALIRSRNRQFQGNSRWTICTLSAPWPDEFKFKAQSGICDAEPGISGKHHYEGPVISSTDILRAFPHAAEIYQAVGWTLPARITRVYDGYQAVEKLGWEPQWSFGKVLKLLSLGGVKESKDVSTGNDNEYLIVEKGMY